MNQRQLEAIRHGDGPLLIIAGAGTGKTTVVTERVKWLIAEGLASPAQILALTFTEKAAREMEERIDVALPYGYTQMWVLTFHSFCDRVLRDEGLNLGLDTNFKLLTEADAMALFKKHLFEFDLDYFRPLGNPSKFIAAILQHFSRLADEDVIPPQYLKWAKAKTGEKLERQKWLELATLYQRWTDQKIKAGVLEFGDLIAYALKLFRDRPNILANYHQKFKYILVDEFQDTNYAQNLLVNLLAGRDKNLTVVADDDQAIYRWRGAAISNVIQFRRTYPQARLVTLVQNYRSTQEVLDRAYDVIQFNNPDRLEVKEKIDKKLVSVRKIAGDKIDYLHLDRVENEAEAVSKKISQVLAQHPKLSYKDFAILVRANNHADAFIRSLARHGIPHQFLGPGRLFAQPEVKDLIAYLKVLYNFEDDASFYRVLAMSIWDIPAREIAALANFAKRQNLHLFEAAEKVSSEKLTRVSGLVNDHLKLVPHTPAGQILYDFLDKSGLVRAMLDYQPPISEVQAQNMAKFFDKLRSFEATHPDASVPAVVDWLDLSMQLGESPLATDTDWTHNDAVNVLTVHSAKGLEFRIVFLVNLVAQRFPTSERREPIPIPDELIKEILPEGDYHLQEERRLFYVGMTRAQDKLFFTAADFYGEGKREKKISPFVFEALGTGFRDQVLGSSQPSLFDWAPTQKKEAPTTYHLPPITYLSYSQIQTFLDCPLHYKAKYILRIPTPPTAAQSFGTSIHQTLKDLYLHPGVDVFELYQKNWLSEGYIDRQHQKQFFAQGKKFLRQFLDKDYDPKIKPVLLEQSFIAPVKLGSQSLKIGGKIDRVDQKPEGSIEIIDYKTGAKVPTQKDVDVDLQMSFYALAASILKEPPFGKDPQDIKLTLYFFATGQKISTTRTAKQLQEAVAKVFDYAEQISRSNFRCFGGPLCKSCEYRMLCDAGL